MRRVIRFALLAVAITAVALSASAQTNLLQNPGFEVIGPFGPSTVMTTAGNTGWQYSAAEDWAIWSNGPASILTDLVSSTNPNGGVYMLHVTTTCSDCGVYQHFLPVNTGPAHAQFAMDVYVVQGCVGVGSGNGGYDTFISASTCVHNQWVTLTGHNSVSPANELIIYAYRGAAEWYADLGSVLAQTPTTAKGPRAAQK